jgi:hypothetical protein
MSDAAKRALMAAAARHRLRTEGRTSDRAKKKPGAGWTPEERAYLVECIAATVIKRIHRNDLEPGDAWFLGRSAARLSIFDGTAKYVHAPRLFDLISLPCAKCHRAARHRVGLRGYCDMHASHAIADRRRMEVETAAAKAERDEQFIDRDRAEMKRSRLGKYRYVHKRDKA